MDIDKRIGSFSHNRNSVIEELSEIKERVHYSSSSLDENHSPKMNVNKNDDKFANNQISDKQSSETLVDFQKEKEPHESLYGTNDDDAKNILSRKPIDLINRRFSTLDIIAEKQENH